MASLPPYNFAGIRSHPNMVIVEGLRATISWTVPPITSEGSAQSTWIGIFGEQDATARLSFRIAQLGWKQLGAGPPRIFWEWGTDLNHFTVRYGNVVTPSTALSLELDRASGGSYTFLVDGLPLGQAEVKWAPRYINVAAETQHPVDVLAGSLASPERITNIQVKIRGQWQPLMGDTFSTYPDYMIISKPNGDLRIWDSRA